MVRHSKKASQAKRVSRRVNEAMVGSHVSRADRNPKKSSASKQATYSTSRRNARARRGMVDTVVPDTISGESATEHSRRVRKEHYTVAMQRRARLRGLAFGLMALLAIAAIATAVGVFVYTSSVSGKMSLSDPTTRAALTPSTEEKPSYVLLVGEFYEAGKEYAGPEMIMLARLDQETKQVTLISIPHDTQIRLGDGEYGQIAWAQLQGGDTALIQEVSELVDVPISHIVKADNEGLVQLVNSFGGISVVVAEEVDDPAAGSIYLEAGEQILSGEAALTYCRATNFSTGKEMQSENQCKVVATLAKKMLEQGGFGTYFTLDKVADCIESDLDFFASSSLIDSFRGMTDENVFTGRVPGYSTTNTETNRGYFVVDGSSWEGMRAAIKEGLSPDVVEPEAVLVDPASFTITVRNGSGVTGGAQQVADTLTAGGYQVTETGNTDQFVYDETLIVYKVDEMKDAAEAATSHLGIGRVIPSNGFYSFETGILVVVGKDWKPLN